MVSPPRGCTSTPNEIKPVDLDAKVDMFIYELIARLPDFIDGI
jgi:hypothetical protein